MCIMGVSSLYCTYTIDALLLLHVNPNVVMGGGPNIMPSTGAQHYLSLALGVCNRGSWKTGLPSKWAPGLPHAYSSPGVMDSLNKSIGRCRYLGRRTKIRVFKTLVLPILLNGCETWTLTRDLKRRIKSVGTKCLRRIMGHTWKDLV